MITAISLTKRYGDKTAVRDLSFDVQPGAVTGFLGPNGSGKSTTMRMVMGLDVPSSGSVLVNGKPFAELRWPLREVGALLDAKAFHPARTGRNHLRWLAVANDIPLRRVEEVLDIVGLGSAADQRVGKYSLGMGQRLGIASALIGDPGVLLFDEPVNGLDPEGIRWVRHFLRDRAAEGRTVFVSSHLITEMSLTAENLVVIGRGSLIAETSVKDFVARSGGAGVRLVTPVAGDFAAALRRSGATVSIGDDGALQVEGMTSAQIGDLAARDRLTIHELAPVAVSLEDAFMELTQDAVEYRSSAMAGSTMGGNR